MHRELTVLDLSCGAGVLPLDTDGVAAFLQIACFIDHQDPLGVPEPGRDEIMDIGADQRVVPAGPADQILYPARSVVTGVFGDRPAVLDRQRREQPGHEVPDPAPRFGPGEACLDRVHQLAEQLRPSLSIYSVGGSHRRVLRSPHNR
jgi:hypothetical protein